MSTPFPLTLPHFPNAVWSIGEHGPTSELVKRLRPLLFKYRVSAYFCGHDHSMQHLREANTTLDYFVVGAGHLTDPSQIHKVKWLEHTSPPATPLSHLSPPPPHADGCSQGLFAFLVRSIGPVGQPWGVCHCQCGSALTQHHLLHQQRWAGQGGARVLVVHILFVFTSPWQL